MSQPTAQEILESQGTRLSDVPPWVSYAASLEEKLDPKLEDAVKRYAEHRHDKSSAQNEEELCRQKELSQEVAKEYQWVTPEEYADAGPRIGKILHSSEVINKLRNECNLRCWYVDHPQPKKLTVMLQSTSDVMKPPTVGCWAQFGFTPEYSIMNFDEHGVPMAEKYRGWRTVLLQLIVGGYLTEEAAHKAFGKASGPACTRYNTVLYGLRNTMKE